MVFELLAATMHKSSKQRPLPKEQQQMLMDQIKKPKGPWYDNFEFWSDMAYKYLYAFRKIPQEAKHHAEFQAFRAFMGTRLVFESNLIEGAGLSQGETQKVIEEYFPHIPDNYEAFRQVHTLEQHILPKKDIAADSIQLTNIVPGISFEQKSKGMREVIRHYIAYLEAASIAIDVFIRAGIKSLLDADRKDLALNVWQSISNGQSLPQTLDYPPLLSEENIKFLHRIIAKNLLPDDAMVNAGEYRIDLRTVGDFNVVFPSPELIPDCMKKFIEDSNSLFSSSWSDNANIFEVAAQISYDFVRIHPFPDFNGRLSRLLLVMVLHAYGLPFAITVRGDKKGRHRYFSSLKRAKNCNIIPYAALIAMRVVETFQEIDDNIMRAGYPSLLSFA